MEQQLSHLELEIRQRIAMEGPLSIADYMALCLTHPTHGYYTSNDPIGGPASGKATAQSISGDFITAPEVSQMFGEMIGVWCMEMWQAMGAPEKFSLVELGPGRGTLMRDLLRIAGALPGFLSAAEVHLVEVSPVLAEQQSLLLSPFTTIRWVRDLDALPKQPSLIIANEFLDALPFRQWVKHGETWRERSIGLINDRLTCVLRPNRIEPGELPDGHASEPDGAVFESSPARESFIAKTAHFLNRNQGAALFIDYGHLQSGFGDTFQAMKQHQFVDPLIAPGSADLTSHVDFEPLGEMISANGCVFPTPTTQGNFLLSLGLLERAGTLGAGRDARTQQALTSAVERLAGDDQMGSLFKVMAFGAHENLPERWPGFK